jgi:hypothetical protein
MAITVDTDHGVYDVLPCRAEDYPPVGATHTVFHDSGDLAGYVAEGRAWAACGEELTCYARSREGAACVVAEADTVDVYDKWANGGERRNMGLPHH